MAKEIPVAELKVAVAALNDVLSEGKIKTVGRKKPEIVEEFKTTMLGIIESDQAASLPAPCIDFFNTYIAEQEEGSETPEEKPAETPAPTKKSAKSGKAAAAPASAPAGKGKTIVKKTTTAPAAGKGKTVVKKPAPAPAAPRGYGLVETIVDEFFDNKVHVTKDMNEKMSKKFPNRNVKSTVASVMCVLQHVKTKIGK